MKGKERVFNNKELVLASDRKEEIDSYIGQDITRLQGMALLKLLEQMDCTFVCEFDFISRDLRESLQEQQNLNHEHFQMIQRLCWNAANYINREMLEKLFNLLVDLEKEDFLKKGVLQTNYSSLHDLMKAMHEISVVKHDSWKEQLEILYATLCEFMKTYEFEVLGESKTE
jgi:hypothetical protein